MSEESRERVRAAIEISHGPKLLGWITQHCFLRDPRGSHWGSVSGHFRTVSDVLNELPTLDWWRVKSLDQRTIFRARMSGLVSGIVSLSGLSAKAPLWVEYVPDGGHVVRVPYADSTMDVSLGSRSGYRLLFEMARLGKSHQIVGFAREATIELHRGDDGRETVAAVYPDETNITRQLLLDDATLEEGPISFAAARKSNFEFALLVHQVQRVAVKSEQTAHQVAAQRMGAAT